ncbi:hypothetical protein [Paraburkholderia sp. D1E]|uniref:hypothetical protein n=1 Tax=Paraburkholderia sp. D1E TaxID=3461398 RepID=UPI0040464401
MFRKTAKRMAITHEASRKSRAGLVSPSPEVIILFCLIGTGLSVSHGVANNRDDAGFYPEATAICKAFGFLFLVEISVLKMIWRLHAAMHAIAITQVKMSRNGVSLIWR